MWGSLKSWLWMIWLIIENEIQPVCNGVMNELTANPLAQAFSLIIMPTWIYNGITVWWKTKENTWNATKLINYLRTTRRFLYIQTKCAGITSKACRSEHSMVDGEGALSGERIVILPGYLLPLTCAFTIEAALSDKFQLVSKWKMDFLCRNCSTSINLTFPNGQQGPTHMEFQLD